MTEHLSQLKALGRYQFLHELGRGGMGVVYLAKDSELGREVAIKCVSTKTSAAKKLASSLRSEAKMLAQLNHPNIVQLYDVIEQDDVLGLVIEFVGGDTLTHRLQQQPSRALKLKWLAEIADGISAAHNKGIAHCDLKSDNVLVTEDGHAKVSDFGIAKVKIDDFLEDDGLTRMESVSGSYYSLSPEQASGQIVDTRTDLFSLGILIFQTLTGTHPFGDTHNKIALVNRIINDPLTIDDTVRAQLASRLYELIANLLNKSPEERLYSASEVAELLRSEQSNTASLENSDVTTDIPIGKPNRNSGARKSSSLITKLGLLSAGFIFGIGLLKVYSIAYEAKSDTQYVALDKLEITTGNGFNQELLPFIESTLQESVEESVLALDNTGLISSREYSSVEGGYLEKARAIGASSIISLSAHCVAEKCDLKLRKLSGKKMSLTAQKSWPVATQFLTGIRNTLSEEVFNLYPNTKQSRSKPEISEKEYVSYTKILIESEQGNKGTSDHIAGLEDITSKQPYFTPAYDLARLITQRMYSQNKNPKLLSDLKNIIDQAPKDIRRNPTIISSELSLKLLEKDYEGAESVFNLAKETIKNDAILLNLESNIAYYSNQRQRLLELDRKNATLRPSAKTLYNLAASEYSFGNYEASARALDSALELYPSYSFALSLKATISMTNGELKTAIQGFTQAIKSNPSGSNFSNLGLSYMLSGEFENAITNFHSAIEASPSKVKFKLNLADAYKLAGNKEKAQKYYEEVINHTANPQTATEFRLRASALAHSENFIDAVKTLNLARDKFPDDTNLNYTSAIIYTLSQNTVAALVEIQDAIERGTGRIWFNLEWFKSLCTTQEFKKLTFPDTKSLCIDY